MKINAGGLYRLTKPNVTYGNVITAMAGYLFASRGDIDLPVFGILTLGTWFVIASACVVNNYLDQDIDSVMERTKKRPLITGEVTPRQALVFGVGLGVAGISLLAAFTNIWTVVAGAVGWAVYVWLYGAIGKRQSFHGTLVGALSGAAPIVGGYFAARPELTIEALIIFAVLFFWQMPEFYSISLFRRQEYKAAGVPVVSVVRGKKATAGYILFYTVIFSAWTMLLSLAGYAGYTYAVVMGLCCLIWLIFSLKTVLRSDSDKWAKRMFRFGLIILFVFSLMISIDTYVP